jgi:uncharacterized protein GlcG (DUF336 family)
VSTLTLAKANQIIAAALDAARQQTLRPMAIVVVDDAGNIKAVQREDGASMARVDIARGKAWAAVSMGASSRSLMERAKDNPTFFQALAVTHQGKFIAQTGAVLIRDDRGDVLGAVGASGGTGDEDEAICIAGASAAGFNRSAS